MDDLEKLALKKKLDKGLDEMGKRLKWARTQLGLMQKEVCVDANVPFTTYFDREEGAATCNQWEILVLSIVLSKHWKEKFSYGNFPEYSGKPVVQIHPMWLYYGGDPFVEDYESQLQECREKMEQQESRHAHEIMELKSQLVLFSEGELGDQG